VRLQSIDFQDSKAWKSQGYFIRTNDKVIMKFSLQQPQVLRVGQKFHLLSMHAHAVGVVTRIYNEAQEA